MPLPNSGPLRLSNIASEFPGETIPGFSKFYRKGKRVVDIPNNSKIPLNGTIRLSDFREAQYFLPGYYVLTINQSAQIDGSDFFWYGYFNGLSTPYTRVTHRNHQNGWNFNSSYTLRRADLTGFDLNPLQSASYGALQTQSSGSFSTGYANYALPFIMPKYTYMAPQSPNEVTGYNFNASQVMVLLDNTSGRHGISLDSTPTSSNGYSTIVLLDDDPPGSNAGYSFRLTFRWVVIAPEA